MHRLPYIKSLLFRLCSLSSHVYVVGQFYLLLHLPHSLRIFLICCYFSFAFASSLLLGISYAYFASPSPVLLYISTTSLYFLYHRLLSSLCRKPLAPTVVIVAHGVHWFPIYKRAYALVGEYWSPLGWLFASFVPRNSPADQITTNFTVGTLAAPVTPSFLAANTV